MVQLSHQYMTAGKTTALTIQTFVGKLLPLLFKTLHIESFSFKKLVFFNFMAADVLGID